MAVKSNLTTMVVCLTVVSLVCSALLGGMYALTAEPISVPKNQYIIAITAAIAMTHEIIVRTFLSSITLSENSFANIPLYVEADDGTETFGFSRRMCMFIE